MPSTDIPQLLNLENISCSYNSDPVVANFNLHLQPGEIGCLLGPSGCGKTTVLRAIAGFQPLLSGHITLKDTLLSKQGFTTLPEKRHVGMVFQDYALFPHLNICDNITFGLPQTNKREHKHICNEMLSLVSLQSLGKRFPHELSGGQQQRVALARALAPQPTLLLMDEPFSSLDVELRRSLALEVRGILKQKNISALLVTHDQQEAFAVADKIGVVHKGQIEQWDTPFNLYHEPATRFVANFVGQGVLLPGTAKNSNTVSTELGDISGSRHYDWLENSPVEILLRPDDIVHDINSANRATVVNKVFAGTATHYTLRLPTGSQLQSAFPSHYDYNIHDSVGIRVEADHLIAFLLRDETSITI